MYSKREGNIGVKSSNKQKVLDCMYRRKILLASTFAFLGLVYQKTELFKIPNPQNKYTY